MRLALSLLCLGVAAVATASAATEKNDVAGAVRVNGWYHCSASTLDPSEDSANYHDDEYFLETKKHGKAKQRVAARSPRAAVRHSALKRGESDAAWEAPFLQDPLEFAQSHASWRATQTTHKRQQLHGKGVSNKHHKGEEKEPLWGDASSSPRYECAEFRVPFCYEGICESNRTLDVFVKRIAAKHTDGDKERGKALWVLQGGPGASSTAMEDLMDIMYTELKGSVSIYTMDHRGTARSHRLECQAAEAQMPGSPGGTFVVLEEVPACIDDILFKIDNQTAAFSVTSAAMDLRTVIDHSLADQDVYVYGLSYGTYLVERLIHVAPKSVKGFVIDGIVSESGASVEDRSTYSNWDHDVGVVGARFFGYCEADEFCKSKFPGVADITQFVKDLYVKLDAGNSSCADVLKSSGRKPSYFLRSTFGELLMDRDARILIPAIVARAARCTPDDADALQYFVATWTQSDGDEEAAAPTRRRRLAVSAESVDLDDVLFTSQMLYSVIVFSEMWEYPSPSKSQLVQWYEDSVMGSDNYATLPYYCLFTGSREDACKALKHLPPSAPLLYKRDAFWNSTAKLPPQTSALLLSGGLDLQTRRMYGNLEYDLLEGDRMLVHFDYAGHCTTFTTPTKSGGPTCGVQILASYVENNGNVSLVDTACVGDVYGLNFKPSSYAAEGYFGTNDAYE